MFEEDYEFLQRVKEYSKRRWKEPLLCTFLWDKYGVNTELLNRERLICRCDTDYASEEDYNLRIIPVFNTTSPFINQTLRVSAYAYNEYGELEEGNFVLYIKHGKSYQWKRLLPYEKKITEDKDFTVIIKYYPPDVKQWDHTISSDEVNTSKPTLIHVRTYHESDYFVSSSGDDNNSGSLATPFKTLQHAMNVVPRGGTVCILTDLTYDKTVLCFTDCNIICKNNSTTLYSGNGQFLTIVPGTQLYLQGMNFKYEIILIYNYTDGHYIKNNKRAPVTIETQSIKPISYKLNLITDFYWISGETVNLKVIGDISGKTIYVFNSVNELITILNGVSEFTYTVPHGLEYDIIRLFVLEDNYSYSETFEVYDSSADWYVDTVNGDNNNSGKSLHDAFKNLEVAVSHVTDIANHVFFMGFETIDNLSISSSIYLRGLKNKSVLYSNSNDYFRIHHGSLVVSDLFLTNTMITNDTYTNNGTTPLTIHPPTSIFIILYVDGGNGDDRHTGGSWSHALRTLQKALTKTAEKIYFSDENTINTPLNVDETVEIVGVMNDNRITNTTDTYFKVATGKVLKLKNITLKNTTKIATITNNIYTNNGTATLEVII